MLIAHSETKTRPELTETGANFSVADMNQPGEMVGQARVGPSINSVLGRE